MKPLKLTMSAFGSYVKETAIDFERLGDGIFLITGDTGQGFPDASGRNGISWEDFRYQ